MFVWFDFRTCLQFLSLERLYIYIYIYICLYSDSDHLTCFIIVKSVTHLQACVSQQSIRLGAAPVATGCGSFQVLRARPL